MDADGLVRAVRAALDGAERLAKAATPGLWEARTTYPYTVWQGTEDDPHIVSTNLSMNPAPDAVHIAHNDPAAVLRRVAADQRVLERHEPIDARVVLTRHVERQVCAYCSDAAERVSGDFFEREWLLEDELVVVKWPCPDFTDLARGLGINPEEETS